MSTPAYSDIVHFAGELVKKAKELDAHAEEEADQGGGTANFPAYDAGDLVATVTPYAKMPDPAGFEAGETQLAGALGTMVLQDSHADFTDGTDYRPAVISDDWDDAKIALAHWEGTAAIHFDKNFISPLPRVVWNQFATIAGLRGALLAEAAMWKQARIDICALLSKADALLDALDDSKDSPGDVSLALGILGTVIGVAAVPFTGGSSGALAWAAASASVSVAGSVVGSEKPPKYEMGPLHGNSGSDVIKSLIKAIDGFGVQLTFNESFIGDKLTGIADDIAGDTHPKGQPRYPENTSPNHPAPGWDYSRALAESYTLARPDLADAKPGGIGNDQNVGEPDND